MRFFEYAIFFIYLKNIFYYVTLEEGRRTKQEGLNADLRTRTSKNSSKGRNKDVIQTENNNSWQEEMHVKPGMSKLINLL